MTSFVTVLLFWNIPRDNKTENALIHWSVYWFLMESITNGKMVPTLANIFLSHFEELWLSEFQACFNDVTHERYVDDRYFFLKTACYWML